MVRAIRVRKRTRGGFEKAKPFGRIEGAEQHVPIDEVSDIMARYTGRRPDLARLYPDPPPPPPRQVALRGQPQQPAPDRPLVSDRVGGPRVVADDEAYVREHNLRLLHKLMLRNASHRQCAEVMGISVLDVAMLKRELYNRVSAEASNIDLGVLTGRTMMFYDEIRASALRGMDSVPETLPAGEGQEVPNPKASADKARYVMLAIAAENNKHRFLQLVGLYDSVKIMPRSSTNADDDDGAMLKSMMTELMDPGAALRNAEALLDGDEFDVLPPDNSDDDVIRLL